MPAIQAYKANGKIIPLSEAKIAKVYQCPWTNDLFATKKAYLKHLKELRENRMHKRARQKIISRKFDILYNQPSFMDIINWIETNPEFLFDNVIDHGHSGWASRRAHIRKDFWVKITYLNLNYSQYVSNSHYAPRGKKTNWSSKDDGPRHYPGWEGRISFQLSHDIGFTSDIFKRTGIHTGAGGGGGNNIYGYDCRMFLEDWPILASLVAHDMFVDGDGNNVKTFSYGKRYR